MDLGDALLVLAGILLAGWFVFARQAEQERAEAFKRVARLTGLSHRGGDRRFAARYPALAILGARGSRVPHVLEGFDGEARVRLADWRFVVGEGRAVSRQRRLVCVLEHPALDLPRFRLRPRSPSGNSGAGPGREIAFDDAPRFAEAFLVEGDPELKVRASFGPRVRDLLLGPSGIPAELQGEGSMLVLSTVGDLPPERGRELLELARTLAQAWRKG